jgi:hypothetical protein
MSRTMQTQQVPLENTYASVPHSVRNHATFSNANQDIPIEELVKSLMSSGDRIRREVYHMNGIASHAQNMDSGSVIHSLLSLSAADPGYTPFPVDEVRSIPTFDSPYKQSGKWPKSQATYFLKSAGDRAPSSSPTSSTGRPKSLSADAPVFTPLSGMDSRCPSDVWELPGLPSPMLEFSKAPAFNMRDSHTATSQCSTEPIGCVSILQRGLSSITVGGQYFHL